MNEEYKTKPRTEVPKHTHQNFILDSERKLSGYTPTSLEECLADIAETWKVKFSQPVLDQNMRGETSIQRTTLAYPGVLRNYLDFSEREPEHTETIGIKYHRILDEKEQEETAEICTINTLAQVTIQERKKYVNLYDIPTLRALAISRKINDPPSRNLDARLPVRTLARFSIPLSSVKPQRINFEKEDSTILYRHLVVSALTEFLLERFSKKN